MSSRWSDLRRARSSSAASKRRLPSRCCPAFARARISSVPLPHRPHADAEPLGGEVDLRQQVGDAPVERFDDRAFQGLGGAPEERLPLAETTRVERDPGLAERLHDRCRVDTQALADPKSFLQLGEPGFERLAPETVRLVHLLADQQERAAEIALRALGGQLCGDRCPSGLFGFCRRRSTSDLRLDIPPADLYDGFEDLAARGLGAADRLPGDPPLAGPERRLRLHHDRLDRVDFRSQTLLAGSVHEAAQFANRARKESFDRPSAQFGRFAGGSDRLGVVPLVHVVTSLSEPRLRLLDVGAEPPGLRTWASAAPKASFARRWLSRPATRISEARIACSRTSGYARFSMSLRAVSTSAVALGTTTPSLAARARECSAASIDPSAMRRWSSARSSSASLLEASWTASTGRPSSSAMRAWWSRFSATAVSLPALRRCVTVARNPANVLET